MADLSDVTGFLKGLAVQAVYPNGSSQPSVTGQGVVIGEGWPIASDLDALVLGGKSQVTVFPMAGTGVATYQIEDQTYTITPPSYGMQFTVTNGVINVTGQPNQGEYLTVIADRANVYSLTGANTAAILAALATAAQAQYPSASSTSSSLTIPANFSLQVRQGGEALLGRVTWRQRHQVCINVWAPTPQDRTTLAKAIDVLVKTNIRVTLPDTSQAIIRYSRTNVVDEKQTQLIYRRDLVYEVEYATLETFPGYVVTSFNIPITAVGFPNNAPPATVID